MKKRAEEFKNMYKKRKERKKDKAKGKDGKGKEIIREETKQKKTRLEDHR